MVLNLGLTDYITFEINASLDKLLSIMQESKGIFPSDDRGTLWHGSSRGYGSLD